MNNLHINYNRLFENMELSRIIKNNQFISPYLIILQNQYVTSSIVMFIAGSSYAIKTGKENVLVQVLCH